MTSSRPFPAARSVFFFSPGGQWVQAGQNLNTWSATPQLGALDKPCTASISSLKNPHRHSSLPTLMWSNIWIAPEEHFESHCSSTASFLPSPADRPASLPAVCAVAQSPALVWCSAVVFWRLERGSLHFHFALIPADDVANSAADILLPPHNSARGYSVLTINWSTKNSFLLWGHLADLLCWLFFEIVMLTCKLI